MLELAETLRGFLKKGQRTVHGNMGGLVFGAYTLRSKPDSKDFKNSPEKKNDPQRFAKKSSKPLRVTMCTMESLVTGFTYAPHGCMATYSRESSFLTRLLFFLSVM